MGWPEAGKQGEGAGRVGSSATGKSEKESHRCLMDLMVLMGMVWLRFGANYQLKTRLPSMLPARMPA